MAYVTVPKDLTKVKSKVVFGLTKRQLICFGGALLIGVPLFFLIRGRVPTSAAALITPLGFSYFLLSPSAHGMSAKELSSSAMLLPTPLASDTGDVGKTVDVRMTPTGSFRKYNPSGTVWTARLSWAVYKLLGSPPGDVKLNPDWVEWLMGFPRRWTDIPCGPKNRRKSRT